MQAVTRRRGNQAMMFHQTIYALLLTARSTSAILHNHLSFAPPFLDVDHFGKRTVGFEWDLTGVAKAMRSFVRLTPDQQAREREKRKREKARITSWLGMLSMWKMERNCCSLLIYDRASRTPSNKQNSRVVCGAMAGSSG